MNLIKITVLLVCILFAQTIFAQNPSVVNGVATYTANMNIGRKFPVPDSWDKIVINENVTITGSFYMGNRSKAIEFEGKDRKTSIIQGDGSRPTDDGMNGRSYSTIRCDGSPDVYVHDLTFLRPMKFHIHGGFGKVTVERCDIITVGEVHSSDGVHGGIGKTIVRDCYIDTYDDATYPSECSLVENTTIVHNKNGSPFMVSWSYDLGPNANCTIRNCTVISNENIAPTDYNHGVIGWAGRQGSDIDNMNIYFEGTFTRIINPGKQAATMYTLGRKTSNVSNCNINVYGICPDQNSINFRGSNNCKVNFYNCQACGDSIAPTVPGTINTSYVTFNSVDISWGASTDNETLTGYEIFVDGVSKATTDASTTSTTLSGLVCEQQQSISILAYDLCGNKSAQNTPVDITTTECPPCLQIPTISGGNGPEATQTAYVAMTLPTTILAENVDNGANGVAYFDNGYGGNVNATRPTWSTDHNFRLDSDIEFDEELGNTFIGGINSGEWAEYTVNVPAGGGTYKLSSVKYSTNSGVTGKVWFKIGDSTSCLFDLPTTTTNKTFTTTPINFEFTLSEGTHVFTWVSEAFGFNLDEFVIVDATSSEIERNLKSNKIGVYPNPFKNELIIITNAKNIELYNLVGQTIHIESTSIANGFNINTANLQQGTYFIKAGNDVQKIVKK